jgi:hypothetical protein
MINIRVLLIIRVLISNTRILILKHIGDLDFECYINICVCVCVYVERERERCNFFFFLKKWRLVCREKEGGNFFFIKKIET